MKLSTLPKLIDDYADSYNKIWYKYNEIYKWKAVYHFQNSWFESYDTIRDKIEESTKIVYNLMDGPAPYLPKTNLLQFASLNPEDTSNIIENLFDNSLPLKDRLDSFDSSVKKLNDIYKISNNNSASLDMRAAMVLLSLRYPDIYYFYKYEMFEYVIDVLDYPEKIVAGQTLNVIKFQKFCELIKPYIKKNSRLMALHARHLDKECYADPNLNILTQDFIYSLQEYLPVFSAEVVKTDDYSDVLVTDMEDYVVATNTGDSLSVPVKIDYEKRSKENKLIGDYGELFIIAFERAKLKKLGLNLKKYFPYHSSLIEGDGLGYDIQSYDSNKKKIFIEVKTTKSSAESQFYITDRELIVSQKIKQDYRLYRVYNFSTDIAKGNIVIHSGALDKFCTIPTAYRCAINK